MTSSFSNVSNLSRRLNNLNWEMVTDTFEWHEKHHISFNQSCEPLGEHIREAWQRQMKEQPAWWKDWHEMTDDIEWPYCASARWCHNEIDGCEEIIEVYIWPGKGSEALVWIGRSEVIWKRGSLNLKSLFILTSWVFAVFVLFLSPINSLHG